MPRLLGLRVQNFKSLVDVGLGQLAYGQGTPLSSLSCFIGPNGSGKSTLLDAFGFMADCLREGVEAACDKSQRGGFSKLRSQGSSDPIRSDLYYRETPKSRPITYSFAVDAPAGVPVVVEESLRQRRKGQKRGRPYPFLRLEKGEGWVWAGEQTEDEEGATSLDVRLDDRGRLGITTLGNLKEHPRIVGLRSYIENWYLSYFVPDAARSLPQAGAQKHLNRTGENLGNVVQYLERAHPDRFQRVLDQIARKIPGIQTISHERSPDGRLLLRFKPHLGTEWSGSNANRSPSFRQFCKALLRLAGEPID
jgi:predicted ATPase